MLGFRGKIFKTPTFPHLMSVLLESLLPNFFWGGDRTEPALWLKAIYFDSGVASTPEQAIARAYDSMPGVKRPDFVPR